MKKEGRNKKSNYLVFWIIISLIIIVVTFVIIILIFNDYQLPWTGINEDSSKKNSELEYVVPQKYLKDLFVLLIIPFFLAIIGNLFNLISSIQDRRSAEENRENEWKISQANIEAERITNIDRQRENSLQSYFDTMGEFQLTETRVGAGGPLRAMARAKTLATIRNLDGARKGLLLKFLFDAELVTGETPIINLAYADFSKMELSSDKFYGNSNLKYVDFNNAILRGIAFVDADLTNTDFTDADLQDAQFIGCLFNGTILLGTKGKEDKANLAGIKVIESKFTKVKIKNVNFTNSEWADCGFAQCEIINSDFTVTKMKNIKFQMNNPDFGERWFKDVDFNRAMIENVDFSGTKIFNTSFSVSEIVSSKFMNTDMYDVSFKDAPKISADFSGSTMRNVNFQNAKVHFPKKVVESPIPDSKFTDCKMLVDVNFIKANITYDQINQIGNPEGFIANETSVIGATKKGFLSKLVSWFKKDTRK